MADHTRSISKVYAAALGRAAAPRRAARRAAAKDALLQQLGGDKGLVWRVTMDTNPDGASALRLAGALPLAHGLRRTPRSGHAGAVTARAGCTADRPRRAYAHA